MRHNPLIFRYLLWIFPITAPLAARAVEPISATSYFNAATGFKPAQRSFQPIFLQMAASLEAYGTPANYLRHVNSEGKRVEAAWLKAKGKPAKFRPEYFTEEYIEKLITGWNQMERVLALQCFTRNTGKQMRFAIMGSWNMPPADLAAMETKLTAVESLDYQKLLAMPFFKKSDFPAMEAFYADGNGYDKLSDTGKAELSRRIERGTMPPKDRDADIKLWEGGTIILSIFRDHQKATAAGIDGGGEGANADDLRRTLALKLKLDEKDFDWEKLPPVERDAIAYSRAIKFYAERRLKEISKQATPEQMEAMESAMRLMYENLLVAAQLEFEAGLWDEVLNR